MYLYGFDGWIIGLGACLASCPCSTCSPSGCATRGKFTVRRRARVPPEGAPVARSPPAINTLLDQRHLPGRAVVGAGAVIEAWQAISFPVAVMICGVFMVVYVVFGGMLATTWVQIIKACMLMIAGVVVAVACWRSSTSPGRACSTRPPPSTRRQGDPRPGDLPTSPIAIISTGLTIFIGTAGLPHILMRFFTVPDSKAARKSVLVTIGIIAIFTALVTVIGFGARAILGQGGAEAVGKGGNLAAPLLAQSLGGGEGHAAATSRWRCSRRGVRHDPRRGGRARARLGGAIAHDLWANVLGPTRSETERRSRDRVGRRRRGRDPRHAAIGSGFNVTVLVEHGVRVRRQRELPAADPGAVLAALQHRRAR
jgi:cation/acetate symporter